MEDQKHRELTNGEYLVGKTFNPSGNPAVDTIKTLAAELIDAIEDLGVDPRTKALAVTNIEQGAMWAVKSATKELP